MDEGLLHHGGIWDDVLKFDAPEGTVAQGVGGGWPCQAGHFARCPKNCFRVCLRNLAEFLAVGHQHCMASWCAREFRQEGISKD